MTVFVCNIVCSSRLLCRAQIPLWNVEQYVLNEVHPTFSFSKVRLQEGHQQHLEFWKFHYQEGDPECLPWLCLRQLGILETSSLSHQHHHFCFINPNTTKIYVIVIIYLGGCDGINFEINLSFLISYFPIRPTSQDKNLNNFRMISAFNLK